MESLEQLSSLKCPLCSKSLANEEYKIAINQLEEQLQKNFDQKNEYQKESFEEELQTLKDRQEESMQDVHQNHKAQLEQVRSDLEDTYKVQSEQFQKSYETLTKQSEKQFTELEKQLKQSHKKELAEKTKLVSQLEKQQESYKKAAIEQANATYALKERKLEQDISERDVQLRRFSGEIEALKKQLTQSQSELKGEAGELDLFVTLTDAFPQDHFRRQKRGTSSGDLIQRIRTGSTVLDTLIVYDNKAANTVTKADVTKAKKYQKIHGTQYVLIVGNNLPKTSVPNGLIGEKDGIILVHPSIVVEVSKRIRDGIIEISKLSLGKEDRQEKQDRLYEYIMSQEFSLILKALSDLNEKLYNLQSKEEKDHQTLWKNRKSLQDDLLKAYNELSSGIESITMDSMVSELAPESQRRKMK
jgi:hypothetical protein